MKLLKEPAWKLAGNIGRPAADYGRIIMSPAQWQHLQSLAGYDETMAKLIVLTDGTRPDERPAT